MFTTLLFISLIVTVVLLVLMSLAWLYGYLRPHKFHPEAKLSPYRYCALDASRDVAILIASRNGEKTIAETVKAALRNRCDVYVVSDASTDNTVGEVKSAGGEILELGKNVGKPAALYCAYKYFSLDYRYKAVAILDDDVIIEDDFVTQTVMKMRSHAAIVVGKNITLWPKEHRWNVWLAKRSYSYWNYQLTIRRLQSHFKVMNCISGSNSLYRVELLDKVLPTPPPYIVDDTFWVLETHRHNYGEIVYAPRARAHLQDPTNFKDWYKQNTRWLWGTFQGIIGHKVGRQWSHFDVAYVLLIMQWILYVGLMPLTAWLLFSYDALWLTLAIFTTWISVAAIQLRKPQLILLGPLILVVDLLYRAIFIHALIKAIKRPTVENCVWDSPARFSSIEGR